MLFNTYLYDENFKYVTALFKVSPLEWEKAKLESLPLQYLKVLAVKYKLPYSGAKQQVLEKIYAFIDLATIVKDNFNLSEDGKDYVLKEVITIKVKDIKPVLKTLNVRHSWLKKQDKLLLCKNQFIERWKYLPKWGNYNL